MRYPGHSPSCPARPAFPSRDRHLSRSGPGRLTLSSSAKLEIWEATKVSRCPAFGSLPAACGPPEVSEGGSGLGRPCRCGPAGDCITRRHRLRSPAWRWVASLPDLQEACQPQAIYPRRPHRVGGPGPSRMERGSAGRDRIAHRRLEMMPRQSVEPLARVRVGSLASGCDLGAAAGAGWPLRQSA